MLIDSMVTTIVPVHNRADLLRTAVASVLTQDYRPIELIIVDDGSTDSTADVVAALATAHPEVIAVRRDNGGPGAARETGRKIARGEYVQYLDSDDRLLPGKFRAQVGALQSNRDCDVAYGQTRFVHADGRPEKDPWKGSGRAVATMFPSFLRERWWETSNPLYRRAICDRIGPWFETWIEEDWEYDCRAAALGVRLVYVPEFVCEHRDHSGHRLSRGSNKDPRRMKDRAKAHTAIWHHAVKAGLDRHDSDVRHFARELFLLARQCGAAGLEDDAASLFQLARQASTDARAKKMDFRLYRLAAAILGWRLAGELAGLLDGLRS